MWQLRRAFGAPEAKLRCGSSILALAAQCPPLLQLALLAVTLGCDAQQWGDHQS